MANSPRKSKKLDPQRVGSDNNMYPIDGNHIYNAYNTDEPDNLNPIPYDMLLHSPTSSYHIDTTRQNLNEITSGYSPYNYNYNIATNNTPYNPTQMIMSMSMQQDNTRKRQRRQVAGNIVANMFQRGGAQVPSTPVAGPSSVPGLGKQGATSKKKQSTAQPRPQLFIPPRGIGPIRDPNQNDVLSGRGGRINAHSGNVQFRRIVQDNKKNYLSKDTKKLEKAHIAAEIVYNIRTMDPPGRFLKEDADGIWWDIGDAKAIKKVGQALREDAPEIRSDEDEEPKTAASVVIPKAKKDTLKSASTDSAESTPKQTSKSIVSSPVSSILPSPVISKSTSSPSPTAKSATAVSARGGKLVQSNSCNSSVARRIQQQVSAPAPQPIAIQQIELAPPKGYQHIVPPPQQDRRDHSGIGGTPFYANLNFRGMAPRSGAISGAAAAAMKQQQQHLESMPGRSEFEVPQARYATDELFGRQFHPAENQHAESSIISGFSGMSAISELSDPSCLASNSGHNYPSNRAARQAQRLDEIRHNWQTPTISDNTTTIQMLQASNGMGSSLNHSSVFRSDLMRQNVDDGMSWAGNNSLMGGALPVRDDSVLDYGCGSLLSGTGSIGAISYGGLSSAMRDNNSDISGPFADHNNINNVMMTNSGLGSSSRHSTRSGGPYRGGPPALAAYGNMYGGQSDAMSVASNGYESVLQGSLMSELSDNMNALDLAENRSILDSI